MILEPNIAATCRLLTERYHRAFDDELPRLENLGWKIAHAADVGAPFARALMHTLLRLKDELLRHTAVAESTVHKFAGTPDGDVLLDEHIADHAGIRAMVTEARRVAKDVPTTTRVGPALKDGLMTLERNLEMYFALERTLVTKGYVPSSSVSSPPSTTPTAPAWPTA